MAGKAQRQEIALWLALLDGKRLARRAAKELLQSWCVREQRPLSALRGLAAGELAAMLGERALAPTVAEAAAQALCDTAAAEATLARLTAARVEVITRVEAAYPEDLAQHLAEEELPYLLFALGALDHLAETGLALGGAHASERLDAADAAQLVASLAAWPAPIVSGYERGVDRDLALPVAAAGGRVTVVLPLGLDQAQAVVTQARMALEAGRALLLSPFMPEQPYSERTAQARLGLMSALAGSLLLVEPEGGPESWPGAAALLARGGVVAVLARQDSAAVQAWAAAGAVLAESVTAAIAALSPTWAGADPEAGAAPEDLPGVEPIYFQDADEAIAVLGRSGRVPAALAQRLRESSVFGYQDTEDVDADAADDVDEAQEEDKA